MESKSYKLEDAGTTKPLWCLAIALSLVSTSLVVGWQSRKVDKSFSIRTSIMMFWSIVALQLTAFIIHFVMFWGMDLSIVSLTSVGVFCLHGISFTLTLFILSGFSWLEEQGKYVSFETQGNFWCCVIEDLNTIVCYVLVYRAFDSQISVHDDTTTFFDVMCVVLIGFLQHVANVMMIFHAHVDACGNPEKDDVNNIARTRALIFLMIGIVTIFLHLRITPTYTEYAMGR